MSSEWSAMCSSMCLRINELRLRSMEGQILTISIDSALMSAKLTHLLRNGLIREDSAVVNTGVEGMCLRLAMEWCEQHKYDARGAVGGDSRLIDDWDKSFFNSKLHVLYGVFMAADQLQIEPLMEATFRVLKNKMFIASRDHLRRLIQSARYKYK